jgi:hypothetical protein
MIARVLVLETYAPLACLGKCETGRSFERTARYGGRLSAFLLGLGYIILEYKLRETRPGRNIMFRVIRFKISRRNVLLDIKRPCRFSSTKSSDPLRILFCGSDDFSVASLKALYKLHEAEPDLVRSIDVACRPPKRTGRGLKHLREGQLNCISPRT